MPRHECGFRNGNAGPEFHVEALVAFGPTIQVSVVSPAGADQQPPPMASFNALIDTGAGGSCIDSSLVQQLGLPIIDQAKVSGVGGAQDHDVVLAIVSLPQLGITMPGRFMSVHLTAGGQPHHVLLGRDMLKEVVMVYDGERGTVTVMK